MSKKYCPPYDRDNVYPRKAILEYMAENDITELEVHEAERVKDPDYFFCRDAWEIGERGWCGRICKAYAPRNSKSGMCKHHSELYESTEKKILIKRKI